MSFRIIKENVLKANDDVALNIKRELDNKGILMVNIISSPGAGKTSLLERAGKILKDDGVPFSVLTGDCFTTRDAERIDNAGLDVIQINTGNACHIDAGLIERSLKTVDLDKMDLIIIENVGNLVCPAEFELGEDFKIAVLSIPEGQDKPLKYPLLFQESSLAVINKIDLAEYTDFDINECEENINRINPGLKIVKMSCKTGEGIDEFVNWVKESIKNKKEIKV